MSEIPEQKQLFDDTLKWCEALGNCTEPVDREWLEPKYREIYRILQGEYPELPELEEILWTNSPLTGGYVYLCHAQQGPAAARVLVDYLSTVTDLMDQLPFRNIMSKLHLKPLTLDGLSECLQSRSLGNLELHWVSRLCLGEKLNGGYSDEEYAHRLHVMRDLTFGGQWFIRPGCIIATDRPSEIHRDENQRLHNAQGAAIRYRDGFGLYLYEGISVPREVIEQPDKITIKQVEEERNAAVRRVLMMQYGIPRYLRDINAQLRDERPGEKLYFVPNEEMAWLVCRDGSTNAIHAVHVPAECMNCSEAQEALGGIPETSFLPRS